MTVRRLLEEHSSKLNPTNMPLLMRQGGENTDYDTAYAGVLDLIMPALWSVDTAESSRIFLAEGAHLIRDMASKISDFYIGEFLGIFKDAVIRQLRDEVAACEREIYDANAVAESASVELTARLTAATTAGDRRAEHEVWRDREIVQSACQSRVDAASRQTDSLKLRLEACEELASQLGHAFV